MRRDAFEHLRTGHAEQAIASYATHGQLTVADTTGQLRDRRESGADAVMIAPRRDDVSDLNVRARAHMHHSGWRGPDVLAITGRQFAVGDQAVRLRNHPCIGVTSGTHGTSPSSTPNTEPSRSSTGPAVRTT